MSLQNKSTLAIDLRELALGIAPGLSAHAGGSLAEAAAVCLEHNKHVVGVKLEIAGNFTDNIPLNWEPTTEQIRQTHADLQDATEDGACGVAIVLAKRLLGKDVLRKSYKGKNRDYGFDYWLGDPGTENNIPFAGDTRLEVSGILNGTTQQLQSRLREKIAQVQRSGNVFPGIAIVVMFSRPIAKIAAS